MPLVSKYANEDVEVIVNELLTVLSQHQTKIDLSLMCLGNTVSHILEQHVPEKKRLEVAQKFSDALTNSVKK